MEKFIYYCLDCDKLYKVSGSGKKVKCNSCGQELADLKISDEEYSLLGPDEKKRLKSNSTVKADVKDVKLDEQTSNGKSSFFDMVQDDFEKKYHYTETQDTYVPVPEKNLTKAQTTLPGNDYDKNIKTSITLSWTLCFLPLILAIIIVIAEITNLRYPSTLTFISYAAVIAADGYSLKQCDIKLGLGWEILGLIFPPGYIFKKSKILKQKYTCAVVSLVVFLSLTIITALSLMLSSKLAALTDNEETMIDPLVTGSRYYDENTKSVLDLTDDRKFVIYLDNNGPSEARVEGRYRVYKGEEAINKIASMPEYGYTKESLEEVIEKIHFVTYDDKPGTESFTSDSKDFYAFLFDIEHNSNPNADVKQNLYMGFYLEQRDTFEMINCRTFSSYRWVRQ